MMKSSALTVVQRPWIALRQARIAAISSDSNSQFGAYPAERTIGQRVGAGFTKSQPDALHDQFELGEVQAAARKGAAKFEAGDVEAELVADVCRTRSFDLRA
jgi:hypothetical protein